MKMNQIMALIKTLARSQGFYGRLLNQIRKLDNESYDKLAGKWESMNFKDGVDFIIYLEG